MPHHPWNTPAWELAVAVWSRRKWLAIVVCAAVFAAAASITASLPDVYRSTATVLVERHQVPEAFVKSSVTGELETRLYTISQEIMSRKRLEDLITRFGLYPEVRNRAPMEAVVERMRKDIQLELKGVEQTAGRGATIAFTLSYRGREPETVARVANTLASFYVEENSKIRERQAAGTAQFLKGQLEQTKKRLDEQEGRVKDFRMRFVGELPQQMAVNLATLERLHAQLHLNSANQLRAMDRRAALEKQFGEADPQGGVAAPDATSAKMAKLKQELHELRGRFTDKYPDVVRVKAEIAALEREVAEGKPDPRPEPAASADPSTVRLKAVLREAGGEIDGLRAEEQRLRREIDAYQRRVENAPQREQEFKDLSRDYETAKDLYSSLLKRYEDAQLAESMEQHQRGEQFRILDAALPATLPAGPNRLRLLLISLLLAVATGAAAVVLAEQFDTSFHTVNDLRALTQVPVLVSIPLIVAEADARRQRWRSWITAVAVILLLAVIVKVSQYLGDGNDMLVGMLTRGAS